MEGSNVASVTDAETHLQNYKLHMLNVLTASAITKNINKLLCNPHLALPTTEQRIPTAGVYIQNYATLIS